jgi:hypothetical protein
MPSHCDECFEEYAQGPLPGGVKLCKLHAAAPALLEALRWIAVTAPQAYHAQGSQAIMDEMIHAARAAIALAEGRS